MVTVFQGIREARRCVWCGGPLVRNQTKFCGNTCKAKSHAFKKSMDKLAELPEPEFRELLRGVCWKRYYTMWKQGGRLHIRWGIYQESQGGRDSLVERMIERAAEPGIVQITEASKLHEWRPVQCQRSSWSALALRVVARMLDRKRREARRGAA